MPRNPKAKRPGRPRLPKEARREKRSVRLPAALWSRMEAHGEITALIETAVKNWLDEHDRSLS